MHPISDIQGVIITELSQFMDNRGSVIHLISDESEGYKGFGECYGSEVFPGAIKAWKLHRRQTQNLVVVTGRIRIVLYDSRTDSISSGTSEVYELGRPDTYWRITIPPNIWQGFMCISSHSALVINCANLSYDPTESEVRDLTDIYMPTHLLISK